MYLEDGVGLSSTRREKLNAKRIEEGIEQLNLILNTEIVIKEIANLYERLRSEEVTVVCL